MSSGDLIHSKKIFSADEVSEVPCSLCNGPVVEFAVPNAAWNKIVRLGGKETDKEYLCAGCFAMKCVEFVERSDEVLGVTF